MRIYDYSDETQSHYTFFSPEQMPLEWQEHPEWYPSAPSLELLEQPKIKDFVPHKRSFIPRTKKAPKYNVPNHIRFIVSNPKEWSSFLKSMATKAGYTLKEVYDETGVIKTRAAKNDGGQFTIHENNHEAGISCNWHNDRDREALEQFVRYMKLNSSIHFIICTSSPEARKTYLDLLKRAGISHLNISFSSDKNEIEENDMLPPAARATASC